MAFHDIAGNSRVKKILKLSLQRQRVPNSMLFCGPHGVGKRNTALILAKALNCLEKTDDACEECLHCRAIHEGNFPDVIEIVAAGDFIKVDQMPIIKQLAYLKPMLGRRRVFLVDEAEKMNEESANSILKVLEEPPLFTHIILITENPAFILQTVKSRCQVLSFSPVSKEEIEQALRERGYEEEKARIMALLVRGDLEQALDLDWEDIQRRRQEAWELFHAIISRGESSLFLRKYAFQKRNVVREDLEQMLELFSSFCRDFVLMKENGDPALLFNPDYESRIREGEKNLSYEQTLSFLAGIDVAVTSLGRNMNIGLLASALYSRMIG
jgi:DNA polymerase-3 subunit delta'